jgi:hypothetical protein
MIRATVVTMAWHGAASGSEWEMLLVGMEISSLAQTLGSWVRILLESLLYIYLGLICVCAVLCR